MFYFAFQGSKLLRSTSSNAKSPPLLANADAVVRPIPLPAPGNQ